MMGYKKRGIKLKTFLFLCLLIFLFPHKAFSQEDKNLYFQGLRAARSGERDFAFMYFHTLVRDFPESEYSKEALFAAGEYYFSLGDYYDAGRMFSRIIDDYPESLAKLFATAYLLKIAKNEQKESVVEKLKKDLIALQQVSLLFRDFKELRYLSPLRKSYKALYFINKIKILIDENIFAEIHF